MHNLVYRGSVVFLTVAVATLAFSTPAMATDAVPPEPASTVQAAAVTQTLLGNDASWPQCAATLPASPAFGIVGVNHGLANNSNTCFGSELLWAQGSAGNTSQPKAAVYVNTGNPALAGTWWPNSNLTQNAPQLTVTNPYGTCTHISSRACAYVYGYSMAVDDFNSRSVSNPSSYRWWLDVETSNTWQKDTIANTADLEGMTAYFTSQGASVGLYSTTSQWATIAKATPSTSPLAGQPSWLAGATSSTNARAVCTHVGLTPGSIINIVQFVSAKLDYDVSCDAMSAAPTPTVAGFPGAGHVLTATAGAWAPSPVALKYQWKRNSVAISGAIHGTYTLTTSDAGKSITVTVTGSRSGNATTAKTSLATIINRALTAAPVPTVSGTASRGHVLTARIGAWAPSPVELTFQWKRNKVAIAGATTSKYTLTSADEGKSITFVVTGTKDGYTTVAKSSAAKAIAR